MNKKASTRSLQIVSGRAKGEPSFLSWLVSILSVGAFVLAFYAGDLVFGGLRIARAQQDLGSLVSRVDNLQDTVQSSAASVLPRINRVKLQKVALVQAIVKNDDLILAFRHLKDGTMLATPTKRAAEDIIKDALQVKLSLDQEVKDREGKKQRLETLSYDYQIMQRKTADLLGYSLPAPPEFQATANGEQLEAAKTDLSKPFARYESGALAGFPILTGIPDGLPGVREVLTYVPESLRRQVRRGLSNTKSEMALELAQIVTQLDALESEQFALNAMIRHADSEVQTLREHYAEAKENIYSSLKSLALEVSVPELEDRVVLAYLEAKTFSNKFGLSLPGLRVRESY